MKKDIAEKIFRKMSENIIFIRIISIYNKIKLLQNKHRLDKNGPVGNIILFDAQPLFNQNISEEIQTHIDEFTKIMEENFSKENLTRMYINLSNLKISRRSLLLIYKSARDTFILRLMDRGKLAFYGGHYNLNKNKLVTYSPRGLTIAKKIFKYSNFDLNQIYSHELLHMSSTTVTKGKRCSGFHHIYYPGKTSIGMGLNEGYTELLNTRIFKKKPTEGIYSFYREVSSMIEKIIGQEKMANLYFSSNLRSLVNELSNYISKNDTKHFLVMLDNVNKHNELINNILEYLIKLYDNKIKKDLIENKITKEQSKEQYLDLKNRIANLGHLFESLQEKLNIDVDTVIQNNNLSTNKTRGTITSTTILTINIITILILLISLYLNSK